MTREKLIKEREFKMKILDIKIDETWEGRFGLEIVGENRSYFITEFEKDIQWSIDSSTFVYFTRLDFDHDRIMFMRGSNMIGLINCVFPEPKIKMILIENLNKFNKENS